jgi:hypothetical protein
MFSYALLVLCGAALITILATFFERLRDLLDNSALTLGASGVGLSCSVDAEDALEDDLVAIVAS